MIARLLNVPLYFKVLGANAGLFLLGAIIGTALTRRLVEQGVPLTLEALFVAAGVAASLLVNFWLISIAFRPLFALRDTMAQVEAGRLGARAPAVTNDPDIRRLARQFNRMLDQLEQERRNAARRAIAAQEEERRRIARELHDETGQALTGVMISLDVARQRAAAAAPDVADTLERQRDAVGRVLQEVRRITAELRPSLLDDLGLVAAIRAHAKALLEPAGIAAAITADPVEARISPEATTALFRIAQEALTNVARHSGARHARVELAGEDGWVRLTVADDGRGFDAVEMLSGARPGGRGFGLDGMRERAQLLGGHFDLASEPGRGTRVTVRIPAKPA